MCFTCIPQNLHLILPLGGLPMVNNFLICAQLLGVILSGTVDGDEIIICNYILTCVHKFD